MRYLPTKDASDATTKADAIGAAYAASIGKPWPMPPDSYGPGRQPEPRESYYQRYYVAPQPDPSKLDADAPPVLPVDDVVAALVDVSAAVDIKPIVVDGPVVKDV
jgi:hypothetical protein